MHVSVVGEKKPGECGDGILGAPDPGTEQDCAGFCQRSVQMSIFNNSCIVYDDVYVCMYMLSHRLHCLKFFISGYV